MVHHPSLAEALVTEVVGKASLLTELPDYLLSPFKGFPVDIPDEYPKAVAEQVAELYEPPVGDEPKLDVPDLNRLNFLLSLRWHAYVLVGYGVSVLGSSEADIAVAYPGALGNLLNNCHSVPVALLEEENRVLPPLENPGQGLLNYYEILGKGLDSAPYPGLLAQVPEPGEELAVVHDSHQLEMAGDLVYKLLRTGTDGENGNGSGRDFR